MIKRNYDNIKKALSIFLVIFFIFSITAVLVSANNDRQSVSTSPDNIAVYVVPAITDNKILPNSSIHSSYISDTISIKASPGEFEPISFVIHANKNITSMTVKPTDLTGIDGTIQNSNVDIRVVKCWYQGGYSYNKGLGVSGRYLTPELLLKDDSLIKVTGDGWTKWNISNPKGKNYLKLTTGSYIDISNEDPQNSNCLIITKSQRPVQDATELKPVTILKGENKQFWVTVHIPTNTIPGNYSGIITLKEENQKIKQIKLKVQVLPIILSQPNLEYSLYYIGTITEQGSISSAEKTKVQFIAEMKDMLDHGVVNPSVISTPTDKLCAQILSVRNQVGLNNTNLYFIGLDFGSAGEVPYYKNLTAPYGVTNIYVYGPDEKNINDTYNRSLMSAIHNAGGKVMNAQSLSKADSVADILDLVVVAYDPSEELANKYHRYGHRIYSYSNPQVVPEYPRIFRINYGLLLWQRNYDGAMDYAYQRSYGDIWNDFDYTTFRDHVFAYPTMNGVIDTIQWEGFREGVDDVRYLTVLQNTIEFAKSQGTNTSAAEDYISNLKNSDLSTMDLDEVRGQMINYTISLQNQLNSTQLNSTYLSDDKLSNQYSPVAAFITNRVSGKAPLTVRFSDKSRGSPTTWKWDFGDGSPLSTEQNPEHIYSKAGIYTVKHTVSNAAGNNTEIKTNYVKVVAPLRAPVAAFIASPRSGKMPLKVQFTDKSMGSPTSWKWSFGDGKYSTVKNPVHLYCKEGRYSVSLTTANIKSSSVKKISNNIKVEK